MIISTRLETTSNREAAKELAIPRRTIDRTVQRVIERAEESGEPVTVEAPRILILDVETAPMLSYLWSFWQRGVPPKMQDAPGYILTWAAKWLDEPEMFTATNMTGGPDMRIMEGLWLLLDDADFVVAHNGDKFDIKKINTQFLLHGMKPPSPYRQIDTLKMVKRCFAFDSNRLDYITKLLYGEGKHEHDGFDMWRGCMEGDPNAFEDMLDYNKQDVLLLERLYKDIRAWDKSHPSAATVGGTHDLPVCTTCGSEDVYETGHTISTAASQFPVWECGECGSQMRGRKSLLTKEQRSVLLVKAK